MSQRKFGYLMVLGLLASPVLYAADWNYSGNTGPDHWAQVNPQFSLCASGLEQSPLDIPAVVPTDTTSLPQLTYNLSKAVLEVKYVHSALEVMLTKPSDDNIVQWNHKDYRLVQFHFHTPSENRLAGKQFPLEVHFVNQAKDGSLAVVAVFFKVGHANAALEEILANLPVTTNETAILAHKNFNVQALLPTVRNVYAFKGSLTTPPCTEGVQWLVMQQPVELSNEQLTAFKKAIPISNARPIQNSHGRSMSLVN